MTAIHTEIQLAHAPDHIMDSYTLSPMQQGMLFHSLYAGQSGMDIEQMVYTLHEQLNVSLFKCAWDLVIKRHPILRTGFQWEGLDEPLQHVHSTVELEWEEKDLRDWPGDRQDRQLREYLRDDRQRGFKLTENSLNRMALFRLKDSVYQLVWTFHHAIIDGRSFVLVLEEVFACYESLQFGKALELPDPRPYRDYIEWLARLDMSAAEDFWRSTLKGFTTPTPLVINRSSESAFTEHTRYAEQEVKLSEAVTLTLKSLAKDNGVTLNNIIQGAWALLLSRYSGEQDVVFGATRACRRSTFEGAESIVGPFINTLPVRINVDPDACLVDWLKPIRNYHLSLREYEHTPLMKIQEWSGVPRGRSLFDSILVFENYELDSLLRSHGGSWANREFELHEQTNYAIALSAWAGPELLLKIAYDRGSFEDDAILRMLGHLKTLLEGMAANPNARLRSLPMLTEQEHRQLLFEWNQTHTAYPDAACIHHLFEAQVERTPDAVAVVRESERLTYRDLNAKVNQLAHHLRSMGVQPDTLVGVAMERSCELIISLLAVLKAGGAYVPLDPSYPKERLKEMLDDARPAVLMTKRLLLDALPACRAKVVCVDSDREAIERNSEENPAAEASSESLAYVIYTSGSTGKPKGVMIEHRSLVNYNEFTASEYGIGSSDRVLQFASASFDTSAEEIFPSLTHGATLVLRTDEMLSSISTFLEKCRDWKITVLDLPTAYWHELAYRLSAEELALSPSLRLVIIGGERALPARASMWVERAGGRVRLVNTYGPTETTIVATAFDSSQMSGATGGLTELSIGRPVHNARVYILDRQGQPVPVGIPGEMYIGGAGVARGYLNRPALTEEKFVPDPFSNDPSARLYRTGDLARYLPDGNIEFCGRVDNQVKIRGFRVELGEIEAVAVQCPVASDVAVLAREDAEGEKLLVAYVVPSSAYSSEDHSAVAGEMRSFLANRLPRHMIPAAFVILEEMPLSGNGKVDRNSLPAPDRARANARGAYVKPSDPLQYQLSQIWEELFDVRPIGITDNFFELGGHSLLSVRMMDRVEQSFGKKLSLATLFEGATIEHLARALVNQDGENRSSPIVEIQAGKSKLPFFYLHGDFNGGGFYCLSLARHLGEDQPFYALQPHGLDDDPVPATIEQMAAQHVKTLLAFQPEGPYILGGHCNGALISFEMARQLEAQGRKVSLVVLICATAANARFAPLQNAVRGYCSMKGIGLEQEQEIFLHLRGRLIRLLEMGHDYTDRIRRLLKIRSREEFTYISNKAFMIPKRLMRRLSSRRASNAEKRAQVSPVTDLLAGKPGGQRVMNEYEKAMNGYVPQRYSGKVALLLPSESPFEQSDDSTLGWRSITAEIDVHTVPGGHLTCITKHVEDLARTLKSCLDDIAV